MITFDISIIGFLRAIIILIAMAAVFFFFRAIFKFIRHLARRDELAGLDLKNIKARFKEIEDLVSREGAINYKIAVMEADKLLDHVLKSMAMPGNTLGERLKMAQYKYPRIRNVWWAHKIRNQLAHEASFAIDRGAARKAVRDFRHALEELGAL